ncbi:MAG: DUF58 domain-containing protein, partial [Gammaproteobacteria bacterium]
IAHGDRLGGLVFSDTEHHELRPRLGRASALRLFQLVCDSWHPPSTQHTAHASAAGSLQRLTRVARPGSLVFLASDFRDLDADSERHLKRLAVHSDLLLMHIYDPVEAELPPPGRYRIHDGTRALPIETGNAAARERYARQFELRRERLARLQKLPGVAVVECRTDEDPQAALGNRFRKK